jgi:hypothetical protein
LGRWVDPSAAELPLPLRRLAFESYLTSALLLLDATLTGALNSRCADVCRKLERAELAKMSLEERGKLAEGVESLIAMGRVAPATMAYLTLRLREALGLG